MEFEDEDGSSLVVRRGKRRGTKGDRWTCKSRDMNNNSSPNKNGRRHEGKIRPTLESDGIVCIEPVYIKDEPDTYLQGIETSHIDNIIPVHIKHERDTCLQSIETSHIDNIIREQLFSEVHNGLEQLIQEQNLLIERNCRYYRDNIAEYEQYGQYVKAEKADGEELVPTTANEEKVVAVNTCLINIENDDNIDNRRTNSEDLALKVNGYVPAQADMAEDVRLEITSNSDTALDVDKLTPVGNNEESMNVDTTIYDNNKGIDGGGDKDKSLDFLSGRIPGRPERLTVSRSDASDLKKAIHENEERMDASEFLMVETERDNGDRVHLEDDVQNEVCNETHNISDDERETQNIVRDETETQNMVRDETETQNKLDDETQNETVDETEKQRGGNNGSAISKYQPKEVLPPAQKKDKALNKNDKRERLASKEKCDRFISKGKSENRVRKPIERDLSDIFADGVLGVINLNNKPKKRKSSNEKKICKYQSSSEDCSGSAKNKSNNSKSLDGVIRKEKKSQSKGEPSFEDFIRKGTNGHSNNKLSFDDFIRREKKYNSKCKSPFKDCNRKEKKRLNTESSCEDSIRKEKCHKNTRSCDDNIRKEKCKNTESSFEDFIRKERETTKKRVKSKWVYVSEDDLNNFLSESDDLFGIEKSENHREKKSGNERKKKSENERKKKSENERKKKPKKMRSMHREYKQCVENSQHYNRESYRKIPQLGMFDMLRKGEKKVERLKKQTKRKCNSELKKSIKSKLRDLHKDIRNTSVPLEGNVF